MGKDQDPAKDRDELRGKKAEIDDDLETAEAKSRSVDERAPEPHTGDDLGLEARRWAGGIPQGALPDRHGEPGEGEQVIDLERKAQRQPKQPG